MIQMLINMLLSIAIRFLADRTKNSRA